MIKLIDEIKHIRPGQKVAIPPKIGVMEYNVADAPNNVHLRYGVIHEIGIAFIQRVLIEDSDKAALPLYVEKVRRAVAHAVYGDLINPITEIMNMSRELAIENVSMYDKLKEIELALYKIISAIECR